jgi:hypothetical protein
MPYGVRVTVSCAGRLTVISDVLWTIGYSARWRCSRTGAR